MKRPKPQWTWPVIAEAKEETLLEFPELPFGTPGHDTFGRAFQALDPEAFAVFLVGFAADFRKRREVTIMTVISFSVSPSLKITSLSSGSGGAE